MQKKTSILFSSNSLQIDLSSEPLSVSWIKKDSEVDIVDKWLRMERHICTALAFGDRLSESGQDSGHKKNRANDWDKVGQQNTDENWSRHFYDHDVTVVSR